MGRGRGFGRGRGGPRQGVGALFFTLSIFGMISIVWAAVLTILAGIGSPIFFYRQIGKALERSS